MKATLEFDLNNEVDAVEYKYVLKASKLAQALWEYDNQLRGLCKHGDDPKACEFREKLWEILKENNLTYEDFQ